MKRDEVDVLFLADHLGYPNGSVHGVTTYCRTVFPQLVARGLRFASVFLGKPHVAAEGLRSDDVEVEFLESSKRDIGVVTRLAAVLRKRRPRLVHVTQQKSTITAGMLAKFFGFAVLAHLHDFEPLPRGMRFVAALTPPPARMLCVSEAVVPVATEQYGMPVEHCKVLPNGLLLSPYHSADGALIRAEFAVPSAAPVLGMASRLDADKRPQQFVRDAARIAVLCPEAHFLVAGDGTERSACERLAVELGLGARIHFTGYRPDVKNVISACDTVALYSLVEACPYAAIEALALGKPVIGFDAGGMAEVVRHGSTGLLAAPGRPDEIVANAVALLTDPNRRSAMSATCLLDAQRFSLGRHIDALLHHYDEVSAGRLRYG